MANIHNRSLETSQQQHLPLVCRVEKEGTIIAGSLTLLLLLRCRVSLDKVVLISTVVRCVLVMRISEVLLTVMEETAV